jgi:hypothetical protein
MSQQIRNKYYVGKSQSYATVNQVLNTLKVAFDSGDYILPSSDLEDGGNVNIVIRGGGLHNTVTFPDNLTAPLYDNGRRLVLTREEYLDSGSINNDNLPIISPQSPGSEDMELEYRLRGVNVGNNNPNVTIQGIRIESALIGILAGYNCNDILINRCFITNCLNAQIYIHDSELVVLTNNIVVGGEYGVVVKFCKTIRAYHNTVFLDGLTALNGEVKAGMVFQGARWFGSPEGYINCIGNMVYTQGGIPVIFYQNDLVNERLITNYNDFYNTNGPLVQLRQDNAQAEGEDEIILQTYSVLNDWQNAGVIMSTGGTKLDENSISSHPVFISTISIEGSSPTSIIDLNQLSNSPLLAKVPSFYDNTVSPYTFGDFNEELIATDSLLQTREKPWTAIGANDHPSANGFFGQDIFTSPLLLDPDKSCDVDPLSVITAQAVDMVYPSINAGYFWSHERPYYLYGTKGATKLGNLARSAFTLPAYPDTTQAITVKVKDQEIAEDQWDLVGKVFYVYHNDVGLVSYEDIIQINCSISYWGDNGFSSTPALYQFKVKDCQTKFVLPSTYQPGAPVVITDDRVNFKDPIDIVHREFSVKFDQDRQENVIGFLATDNLISNSVFDVSSTYRTPSYWNTAPVDDSDPDVFMVADQYAYMGDMAVGLKTETGQGWIQSNTVKLDSKEHTTISWHSVVPTGLENITGHCYVNYYDHFNDPLPDHQIHTEYDVGTSYQRHYLTIGPSDININKTIEEANSAPLVQVSDLTAIPDAAIYMDIVISGGSSAYATGFMVVDAVQVEYSSYPTMFHPQISFDNMTVEYETNPSGIFVDKRMNITPFFNENPNGFLYIADLPANLWDGPRDFEVTTLHEYRWPKGRLNILPWARLHGKDKLIQKTQSTTLKSEPLDVITPFVAPKKAVDAMMLPGVLNIAQDSTTPDGFNIRVIDAASNSYALRRFTIQVYEPNDNFPGWLSKRRFGAKEQLGMSIYGQLNSYGAISAFYSPPSSDFIRYVGTVPGTTTQANNLGDYTDTMSTIKMPYNVSLENNGNITIIGKNGRYHNIEGNVPIEGEYYAVSDETYTTINLEYPPVFGSTKIYQGTTKIEETFGDPQQYEFLMNYGSAQVILPAGSPTDVHYTVEYLPKYAYPDPSNNNSLIMHNNQIFGDYIGPIQIDYDAQVFIEIRVQQVLGGEFVDTFPVILQNPQLSNKRQNPLGLEY